MCLLRLLVSYLVLLICVSLPCSAELIENVTIDLPKSKSSDTSITIEETIFDIPQSQSNSDDKNLNNHSDEEILPKSKSGINEAIIEVPNVKSYPTKLLKDKAEREDKSYGEKTASKFGNGVIDIATSLLEIPKTIISTTKKEGIASGLTFGLAKGVANTAGQAVTGAANIVSFPVPQEIENPMKAKKSNIEALDMENEFGDAFSHPSN